jgi:hypothetical protein
LAENGDTLEVDYPKGVIVNPATGATLPVNKYPAGIEQIFECGGLLQFAYERYIREAALAGRGGLNKQE